MYIYIYTYIYKYVYIYIYTYIARGGIREDEAFLGHERRGPVGTGRGGVSMAAGQLGQGAGKGDVVRGHRLPSTPWFF